MKWWRYVNGCVTSKNWESTYFGGNTCFVSLPNGHTSKNTQNSPRAHCGPNVISIEKTQHFICMKALGCKSCYSCSCLYLFAECNMCFSFFFCTFLWMLGTWLRRKRISSGHKKQQRGWTALRCYFPKTSESSRIKSMHLKHVGLMIWLLILKHHWLSVCPPFSSVFYTSKIIRPWGPLLVSAEPFQWYLRESSCCVVQSCPELPRTRHWFLV